MQEEVGPKKYSTTVVVLAKTPVLLPMGWHMKQ